VLVDLLAEHYPLSHEVILYEAASLPFQRARISYLPLSALPDAEMNLKTTMVVPPARKLEKNQQVLARLAAIRTAELAAAASPEEFELPEGEYQADEISN